MPSFKSRLGGMQGEKERARKDLQKMASGHKLPQPVTAFIIKTQTDNQKPTINERNQRTTRTHHHHHHPPEAVLFTSVRMIVLTMLTKMNDDRRARRLFSSSQRQQYTRNEVARRRLLTLRTYRRLPAFGVAGAHACL